MEKDVVNKSNKSLSIVLLLIIGLSFTYCKNEIIRYYYESGELETEQLIINDSMSYVKDYYKNGKLRQEGTTIHDSIMDGNWKFYFSDGVLQWQGNMVRSKIQDSFYLKWGDCYSRFKGIEVEGHPKKFVAGRTYKFRVIMPQTNPQFYSVVDVNYKDLQNNDDDFELYPFVFTAPNDNYYILKIVFIDKNGAYIVGNAMYVLNLRITNSN